MPVRSRQYNIPPVLNTKSGRRLLSLIPEFFSQTPDSSISQIVRAIGGMVESHGNQIYSDASATFTNYFSLYGHPYTWYVNMPTERFRDITITSHLESRDEVDFLRTAAIGHVDSVTNMLTPIQISMADPSKFIFHIEYADQIYNRRLSLLDDSNDLYKSTVTTAPSRISSSGILSTASTDPYFERPSAYGTPVLQIKGSSGAGTPANTAGQITEQVYSLHNGGFYETSGEIVPNTVTVNDKNGVLVDASQYTVSSNRITPAAGSGNGDINLTPISITYIPKRLSLNPGLFAEAGQSLRLLQSGTLTVTNVFRDEVINSGQVVKIEVVSPSRPNIESIKVVYSGTTYLGTHVVPAETTLTDVIVSIEAGEVLDSYIITLHSASVISAWKIDAATPAPTSAFTVSDLTLAMSSSVRNEFNRDLYVIIDNKLSIFEPFPLKRKEILLEAGQKVFSGSAVTGEPSIATNLYLYLDGVLYEVSSSTIQDLDGNTVAVPEKVYSYAYIAMELDLETMYTLVDYTFEDMAIYQDTLIFLARKDSDSTTKLVYVDINTLKEVQAAVDPLDASTFSAFSQTYDFTHLKSITCTDYGSLLMMWNTASTTAITEHFLEYDVCYYNTDTEQLNFPLVSTNDFAFTEGGNATTITRANMSYDSIRHVVDQKASIYTALKDSERESMRERPHFSSGYTLLDFYNSYLTKRSHIEDTTEQGLINAISRITRTNRYSVVPKLTKISLPEYNSISGVWIVDAATNTKYEISAESTNVSSGSTSSSFTASSFMCATATPTNAGFLVKAEFTEVTLNTAIPNRESSVFEGIILEIRPGESSFKVSNSGLIARERNGYIVLELTKPIALEAATVYYIGVQSDIVDNFTGTKYSETIGKTFDSLIPFAGLSSAVTDAPKITTTWQRDLGSINPDTVISGGNVTYFAYDYGILLNTHIPGDYEIVIDYTQLIDGLTVNRRFFKASDNTTAVARGSDYVEVAVS